MHDALPQAGDLSADRPANAGARSSIPFLIRLVVALLFGMSFAAGSFLGLAIAQTRDAKLIRRIEAEGAGIAREIIQLRSDMAAESALDNARYEILIGRLDQLSGSFAERSDAAKDATIARVKDVERQVNASLGVVRGSVETLSGQVSDLGAKMSEPSALASLGMPSSLGTAPFDNASAANDLASSKLALQGRAAYDQGRYLAASQSFEEAFRLRPDSRELQAYALASRFRLNPSDSTSYGRLEAASKDAIAGDANDVIALDALARLALERGRWQEAVDFFERLFAIAPPGQEALMAAVAAAQWAGLTEAAERFSARMQSETGLPKRQEDTKERAP